MKASNNRDLRRLVRSFILFFAVCYFMDFGIGTMLKFCYFKQESGEQYRTTYALEKQNAEFLVFGSSRANHHYVPDVFEGKLNRTFYNVGRDGTSIFYHYAILKGVLKRYRPQIVILDILKDELDYYPQWYDRQSMLLPYYNTHSEIRQLIEMKSPHERLKLLSHIYPYNSTFFTVLVGNMAFNKRRFNESKGYIPRYGSYRGGLNNNSVESEPQLDSNKVRIYRSFILDCKNMNAKLYVVVSPYLTNTVGSNSIDTAKRIAQDNNVPFLDFSRESIFLKKSALFYDPMHLNDSGAHIFSNILAERIKNNIR